MHRALVCLLLALAACGAAAPRSGTPPSAEGLLTERCATCHTLAPIYASVGTLQDWHAVVHRMVYHHKGKLIAHVSDEEAMAIADWLAQTRTLDHAGVRIGPVATGRPL